MNLIVENSPRIQWYSDLRPFFSALEPFVCGYLWLWSDVEVNAPVPVECDALGRHWISGPELCRFVDVGPQFGWSVLSAIPPERELHAKGLDIRPYADGNPEFWIGKPEPQHPDADFEIVCWDSSCTLLIGAIDVVAAAFRRAYPDAIDLDLANSVRKERADSEG